MNHKILCRSVYSSNLSGYDHQSYVVQCTCGYSTEWWSQPEYAFWTWIHHYKTEEGIFPSYITHEDLSAAAEKE